MNSGVPGLHVKDDRCHYCSSVLWHSIISAQLCAETPRFTSTASRSLLWLHRSAEISWQPGQTICIRSQWPWPSDQNICECFWMFVPNLKKPLRGCLEILHSRGQNVFCEVTMTLAQLKSQREYLCQMSVSYFCPLPRAACLLTSHT